MEIERKEQTAQMSQDVVQNNVSVEQDNVGFIINLMSSKLYKNRRAAFLREILSNAIDSNAEAKVENPVLLRIYLDENREFHVQIRDYGVGLSEERFQNIYVNIGSSTKRKDNTQQGGFGIGRFSALSYANYASVTSFYEGIRYEYAMYHDGDTTSVPKLSEAPTDEPNGVLVDIAFNNIIDYEPTSYNALREVKEILALMLGRFSYFQNLYVDLDFDFEIAANQVKYGAFINERKNLEFALEKINNNLVLNKTNYIFSKNTFVNGLNTSDENAVPYLNVDNKDEEINSANPSAKLHIVVGENVYYPLDYNEVIKHIRGTNSYTDHAREKFEEYLSIGTPEAKEKAIKYQSVIDLNERMSSKGIGLVDYLNYTLKLPIGIKIPIGVLDILPNREEFIYNKATALRILDIIFIDFLPELERDLAQNNVKDFASYKELVKYYKDSANYETIGDPDTMSLYVNHEERLKINIFYEGDFSTLLNNSENGFQIYKTMLSKKYNFTIDNYFNESQQKRRLAIKVNGEKHYRLYYFIGNKSTFTSLTFITVKGIQVREEIVKRLLSVSSSLEVFNKPYELLKTPLFSNDFRTEGKVDDLFKNHSLELSITSIGENNQITKRFAKGKTSLTNGRNYGFSNIIRGTFSDSSLALVLADTESLKPIQKAYLMSEIIKHPFTNHLIKGQYGTPLTITGVGQDKFSPVVHFFKKSSLVSKEKFASKVDGFMERLLESHYPERKVLYDSPVSLMKKMIQTMKDYQTVSSLEKDCKRRAKAANDKLDQQKGILHAEKRSLEDKHDVLELRIKAIQNNEGSYSIPSETIILQSNITVLNWNSDKSTWKKVSVSSNDDSILVSLKSKLSTSKLEIEEIKTRIEKHRQMQNKVSKDIKFKFFTNIVKQAGLSEFLKRNTVAERNALVNRSSDIFIYPEDIAVLSELEHQYYEKTYDYIINTLFVDFSDVTEVTPEFLEKYNNARKEDRGSNPREVVNIRQLFPKSSMSKGYDFHTYKNTAEGFLEAFKLDRATKRLYNPLIFVYGSVGKTILEEENNLVNMFFYTYRHYERYITQSDVKGLLQYYSNESDIAPQFIFLDIPVTKQKFFKGIPNYIHIDDFMSNLKKYRQVRRLNTALLIESQAQGLSKFSSIVNANPNIFREHFSNKITRLALFMEKHTSKLNRSLEEELDSFKKDMLEKALEEGLFEQNILDLYESCKNELQDMKLVLACSQDVIEGSFLSTSKPNSTQIEQGLKHFENIGWSITKNTASLGIVLINGTINTGRSYNDGSVSGDLIHPIVADFLVKTLKQRKNIIPRYEACNNSVINLNS